MDGCLTYKAPGVCNTTTEVCGNYLREHACDNQNVNLIKTPRATALSPFLTVNGTINYKKAHHIAFSTMTEAINSSGKYYRSQIMLFFPIDFCTIRLLYATKWASFFHNNEELAALQHELLHLSFKYNATMTRRFSLIFGHKMS